MTMRCYARIRAGEPRTICGAIYQGAVPFADRVECRACGRKGRLNDAKFADEGDYTFINDIPAQ